MRIIASTLGLLLTLGSAAALRYLDPATEPRARAEAALTERNFPAAVALYQEALRRDPASAYRWADLAEAFYAAGDTPRARQSFDRALQLGPHILPVSVRDANFHFQLGEPDQALASSARILATAPDYDEILFSYLDRLVPDPNQVLAEIGSNQRATISYLHHLVDAGNVPSAEVAWRRLLGKRYADDPLAAGYIDFLLRQKRYDDAVRSWTDYLGSRHGDYPARNLLFNGGFETNPTGAAFDWRIQPSEKVDTTRDKTNPRSGTWSIHITFHGDDNVTYDNVMQTARVHAGPHRLTAWIRSDAITTNEGIRFRVFDAENPGRLDYKTSPIGGTHDWTRIDEAVAIPSNTNIVTVEVCRTPSQKFDNKIAGSAWIDDVSLASTR